MRARDGRGAGPAAAGDVAAARLPPTVLDPGPKGGAGAMGEPTGGGVWWRDGVIYQIYPRSFKDSDGDGVGDLGGVLAELDYVAALGVDAVWLSPVYRSPMADFGYDVSDHTDIDPLFGDLALFDRFVVEAHRRGLRVVMDFVPNHTSDEHPWFVESRASRSSPRRDWYIWKDPAAGGGPPNNWLSIFGGRAWQWDETTGQYYLHTFLVEQPDLNWRSPAVREAMLDVLRFWLRRGVDGFRVDAPDPIAKDPLFGDNPPNTGGVQFHRSLGDYDSQLHLNDRRHADLHGFFREMRAVVDEFEGGGPRALIGEIHDFDWPRWSSYYGAQLDELHMPFNFGLLATPWRAADVRAMVDAVEAALPAGAQPNYVLGNHDEPRVLTRVGGAQARVAMMLLLTLRGTPTLYYGDELAMRDVAIAPERARDPWGIRCRDPKLGRDGARTPMQWTDGPNAGFCAPGVEPWLPVANDHVIFNRDREERDPHSMLALTRTLLALRRTAPALHTGTYRPHDDAPEECFVYERRSGDEVFVIALNFGARSRPLPHAVLRDAEIVVSTGLDRPLGPVAGALDLLPNEGYVLRLPAPWPIGSFRPAGSLPAPYAGRIPLGDDTDGVRG